MLDTHPAPFSKQTLLNWPTLGGLNRMRRRFGSRIRSRQSPTSNLATLQTSFDPADTLRALRSHRWSFYDGQYLFLILVGIFSLSVIEEPGAIAKTFISMLLMAGLLMPITRQFLLPFLPIASWLILFYAGRYVIPSQYAAETCSSSIDLSQQIGGHTSG